MAFRPARIPLYAFALVAPLSVAAGNVAAGLLLLTALGVAGRPAGRAALPRAAAIALGAALAVNLASLAAAPGGAHHPYKLVEEWWLKLLLLTVPVAAAAAGTAPRRLVRTALAGGALAAAYGVLQHFQGWDLVRDRLLDRNGGSVLAVGFSNHHLSYGGQLMVLAMAAAAWALQCARDRSPDLRLALPAVLLLALALVWTFARSCLLGALAGAGVLILLQGKGLRRIGLAVLLAAAAGGAATPSVRGRLLETFTDPKEVGRLNLWRSSLDGIAARPLAGWGPGNFDAMMAEHEYPGFYEAKGHAHNDLLMQGVNAGVPGILAFLALQVVLWRRLTAARARGGPDAWVPAAGLACLAAVFVAGFFQVFQTDDEPEMLLYFLLGCGLAAGRDPAAPQAAAAKRQ